MSLIGGIYKIVSPTNKIYVGQAVNFERRKYHYSIMDCKGQTRLYRSIKKYGWEAHSFIIIECCEEAHFNSRERFWQDEYNVIGKNGLNCKLTTTENKSGQHSELTKKKISKAITGLKRSEKTKEKMRDRWNSEGYKEKMKEVWKKKKEEGFVAQKRKHSETTKKKMSEKFNSPGMKGKKHSELTKEKMREARLGTTHTEKTREKLSKTNLGKKLSKETIEKRIKTCSEKRKRKNETKEDKKNKED